MILAVKRPLQLKYLLMGRSLTLSETIRPPLFQETGNSFPGLVARNKFVNLCSKISSVNQYFCSKISSVNHSGQAGRKLGGLQLSDERLLGIAVEGGLDVDLRQLPDATAGGEGINSQTRPLHL